MDIIKDSIDKLTLNNRNSWKEYWISHFKGKKGQKLIYLLRTKLIARSVRYFINLYFKDSGIFVEMGSGSSQTSVLIRKKSRLLYCLDFAFEPLVHARLIPVIDGGIQSDLFHLPLRRDSMDGIWNLGVMEHFTDKEIDEIFKEFNRVLKPGACAILFWPPYFGWYKLASSFLEKMLSIIKRKHVKLYPDEINLFISKKKIQSFCEKNGFELGYCRSIPLDLFTYMVIVIRKYL